MKGSEIYIGRSMAEHPQWFPLFETIGLVGGDDELADGTNPYEHITLHMLVGAQIFHQQPPQATRFYKRRLAMGNQSHEIAHIMIAIFKTQLIQTAHQGLEPNEFDLIRYGKTLKSLETMQTEDLWIHLGHAEIPETHTS